MGPEGTGRTQRALAGMGLVVLLGCVSPLGEGEPKRYRAWCNTEERFLGPPTSDEDEAKRERAEHKKRRPWDQVVIWATRWPDPGGR